MTRRSDFCSLTGDRRRDDRAARTMSWVNTLSDFIRSRDGLAQTQELFAFGVSSRGLTALVRAGILIRVRQGWYALPSTRDDYVRAVRVGGRLASVSAAASYDLATPHHFPLHVHVPHNASRLRSQHDRQVSLRSTLHDGTVVHRDRIEAATAKTRFRVSVIDCLAQVVRGESEEDAVACLDSALRLRVIDQSDLATLRDRIPQHRQYVLDAADGRSDGYPESVARRRLINAGIPVQIQVPILGERWLDILIGERLALEIDGVGKYTQIMTPEAVAHVVRAERERDAFLEALGIHVLRVSYTMVVFDWPATLAMIRAVMDRGDHLARSKFRHPDFLAGEASTTLRREYRRD